MKKLFHCIILLGVLSSVIAGCQLRGTNSELIQLANEQVGRNLDSLEILLEKVERPLNLKGNDRLMFAWLSGYLHYKKDVSMVEDSLLVPAADIYISRKDSERGLLSYLLKAQYFQWLEKPDEALEIIKEGFQVAKETNDTFYMQELLVKEGRLYRFVWHDYKKCVDIYRQVLAIKETPILLYSLGLVMALEKNDSSVYYMNRSAEFFLQEKDTTQAVFILRNLANTQAHLGGNRSQVINTVRRILALSKGVNHNDPRGSHEGILIDSYRSMINAFLHLGKLDSAQHYVNESWKLIHPNDVYYLMEMNQLTACQAMIDYVRKGAFDLSKALFYNDSLCRKKVNQGSTTYQLKNSNQRLTADSLVLMIERQRIQFSLMVALVVILALGMIIIIVVNLYRRKLRKSREQINAFILIQQKNERIIRHNEQLIADLQHQIVDGQEAQEQLEESKAALIALQQQTEALRGENANLQQRIEKYKHQPSEEEIEKWKANANRMYQLEERERELTAELANNNELMRKLRENPKFLGASEWKKLEDITNRIYNHFTERIKSQYPHLTEVDIQLCILLKLRFTVSQIAILTATSPSSVSVQKNRLKKRLLQKDEHLFENGQTLDMYLWMY